MYQARDPGRKITWFGYGLIALLCCAAGCGEDETVLAEVGEIELTRADYEVFVGNLPPQQNYGRGAQAPTRYLQAMVDQELLLMEARERRLYDDPAIQSEIEFITRRRLAELYQAEVIAPRIEITRDELEREFVDSRLNRERLLSRILVRTPEDRDRVLAGLAEGRPFQELLEPFAPNDAIAEGDGVVGWFTGAEAERRFAIPRRVFFSLRLEAFAEPVRLRRGWQIYRFLGERTPGLDDYYQEVRRLVRDRKWKAGNREDLEKLKHKYEVAVDAGAMQRLLDFLRESRGHGIDGGTDVLYRLTDGAMNLGQAVGYLRDQGLSGPPPDREADALFEDLLLRPMLFAREAAERGWDQEREFADWQRRERDKLVLTTLMDGATQAKAQIDSGAVQAYYEANKERFRTSLQVDIRQLTAYTAEAAADFRRQLEEGTPIGRLLIRRDAETYGKPRSGELTLTSVLKPRYPALIEAAFAAQEGEWVGPLETKDGHYAVFEVLERRESRIEPFAAARPRVEGLLRQQRESELIGQFISALREKYADRVVLYPDRLAVDEES